MEAPQPHEGNLGAAEPRVCGAKTRSGTPCRRRPLAGRNRCRLHGGSTPAGIASPHFRHGKRSRYFRHLPKEIGEHYQAALHDEQLVSLREQLALLEARMLEVAGKLKEAK